MALVGQRYLMAIGGNDGESLQGLSFYLFCVYLKEKVFICLDSQLIFKAREIGLCFPGKRPLADVWALDTAAKPYEWRKLEPEGEGPPPCM